MASGFTQVNDRLIQGEGVPEAGDGLVMNVSLFPRGTIYVDNNTGQVFARNTDDRTVDDWVAQDGGAGEGVVNITYATLSTAISESTLTPGNTYKISDKGDRGLFFTAISTSELSKTGVRKMLCPAFYGTGANGGNTWIGVWNATKNPNIGDLTIWGGLVWESVTGDIGTADSDFLLDAVNWVVVPKASFSNGEYIEMQFGVSYDIANDWIERQWDGNGNEFGVDFTNEALEYGDGINYCDVSDWNWGTTGFAFFNNKTVGFFNNSCGAEIIRNYVNFFINNNSNDSTIQDNWVGAGISYNSNSGNIIDNYVDADIESNSNSGAIAYNRCQQISENSNGGSIRNNIITGEVTDCSNVGNIEFNMNNGSIESCASGVDACNIHHNINNGDISGTFSADVTDTVVNKS